jgi:very-short-patch-repair endonuclease
VPDAPDSLRLLPFRGSVAVAKGLVTPNELRGPRWRRLFPDVYVAANVPMDHRMWCHAAMVYANEAGAVAISGLSAAHVWGVELRPGLERVELTMAPGSGLRTRDRLTVRHRTLAGSDIDSFTGIAVTSGVRTAFDLARDLPRVDAIIALDSLTHALVVSLDDLRQQVDAIAGFGIKGCRTFANAVRDCEPLAESPMETRTRLVLVDGGLPRPVAQYEVRDVFGRLVARVDLAYPHKRIALEYDGDYHRSRDVFQKDIRRKNALSDAGWTVITIAAAEVFRSPERIVERVRRLLADPDAW